VEGGRESARVCVCVCVRACVCVNHAVFDRDTQVSSVVLTHHSIRCIGFILEFMGTLILLFTIYNTAIWSANIAESSMSGSVNSAVAPIPIGFAVLAAHLALGPLTGCGINPMRVLGGCIMEDRDFWDSHTSRAFWIYFVGENRILLLMVPRVTLMHKPLASCNIVVMFNVDTDINFLPCAKVRSWHRL
jgi:hypothetical protein